MWGAVASLLMWVLKLFGVGKVDPVADAKKDGAALAVAQGTVKAMKKADETRIAIEKAEEEKRRAAEKSRVMRPGDSFFRRR